jgi:uncharacterized protein YcbK (DUF882 family)
MGDLSKNFSRKELECPCCGKYLANEGLLGLLETIRDAVGKPVTVNSGTRCVKHNASLRNSSPNSGHLTGEAADIQVKGMSAKALGDAVKALYKGNRIGQLTYCYLIGKNAVHVGVDRRARRNVFAF